MKPKSHENLKPIHFGGELLPNWAQLLDVAAKLCPVSEEERHWFSLFTSSTGGEDARTVVEYCSTLRQRIQENREAIAAEFGRSHEDTQPSQIIAAWMYSLDTMIQVARTRKTCSWTVEGEENGGIDDSGGGDVTLRRV